MYALSMPVSLASLTWENKENMSETNDVDIVVSASQKKG